MSQTRAYLRVSTDDQDLEKNKASILHLANDKDLGKVLFIEEKVSGRKHWRERSIGKIIDELGDGDNLIVSELTRVGRNMLEIMEVLSIALRKGINVFAAKGNWQLDDSIQSKVFAMAFSIAAEIQVDLIRQQTREALRERKRRGVKLGRPKGPGKSKLDKFQPEIEALLNNGATQKFIADRYGTTEANLSNWMKKRGLKRARVSK